MCLIKISILAQRRTVVDFYFLFYPCWLRQRADLKHVLLAVWRTSTQLTVVWVKTHKILCKLYNINKQIWLFNTNWNHSLSSTPSIPLLICLNNNKTKSLYYKLFKIYILIINFYYLHLNINLIIKIFTSIS